MADTKTRGGSTALRVERVGVSWLITDPSILGDTGVTVDAAVVLAVFRRGATVEGVVTSVFGLDVEVAEHLDRAQLLRLGVGKHPKAPRRQVRGVKALSLNQDGTITRWAP